jgi:hypothetical protein
MAAMSREIGSAAKGLPIKLISRAFLPLKAAA